MPNPKVLSTLILLVFLFNAQFVTGQSLPKKVFFSFVLKDNASTSAGVYQQDGTLLRTLWSGVKYTGGTHQESWDGLDDLGNAVADNKVQIKVLSDNVKYEWEGARIGNTSTAFTGNTKHRLYEPVRDMVIVGNTAYVAGGYNEAWPAQFKFDITKPQEKTWIGALNATDQATDYVATDGKNVYWGGYDALEQKMKNKFESFVFVTSCTNDAQVDFGSNGTAASMEWGHVYPSTISYMQTPTNKNPFITGMAVMKNGNYLFVARGDMNQVQVIDKTTGQLIQTINNIKDPERLAIDGNDNLWMVHESVVEQYKVNADGSLTSTRVTINSIASIGAITISGDNKTVMLADLTTQQVKAYTVATGAYLWTLGQSGGYMADATVNDDKFYFADINGPLHTYLAYAPDGSFWVGDIGNFRSQHYSASRTFVERIMSLPNTYTTITDPNNTSRLFANFLEFKINYNLPLGANNGSWTLVKNWGAQFSKADYDNEEKIRFVVTLSNGRTYGTVRAKTGSVYPVIELVEGGVIRFTGINFPQRTFIAKDGSTLWNPGAVLGMPCLVYKFPFLGFNGINPIWSLVPQLLSTSPPVTSKDPIPWEGFRSDMVTTNDKIIYFDYTKAENGHGEGYHLGAISKGDTKWLWRTAQSTWGNGQSGNARNGYTGPFPEDGNFDSYNGTVYPGGSALISGNNIFWGYHGEFWKQSQTNKWNHIDAATGLFVGQFGVLNTDFPNMEAPPGAAGNVFTGSLVEVNGVTYLYHNDEGINNGVHRWKITGLNTIDVQVATPLPNAVDDYTDGTDLMAGLSNVRGVSLINNTAGWTRTPLADITTDAKLNYYTVQTGTKTYDKFKPTDVQVTYRQNSGNYAVVRDLGNNSQLNSWKLSGKINFEGSVPNTQFGGCALQVLDNNDKIITSFYISQGNLAAVNVMANDKLVAAGDENAIKVIFGKTNDLEISADAGILNFKYGDYPSVSTKTVFDATANWKNPVKLRMYFFTSAITDNYNRMMNISEMKFSNTLVNTQAAGPNTLPSINITSPGISVYNTLSTTVITTDPKDTDGSVYKVELFAENEKIGETFSDPYTFSWTPTATGTYSITAKVTDNKGGSTVSNKIDLKFNVAPTVSIISPVGGSVFTLAQSVAIAANAFDSDGTISKVEFYAGANKIGETTSSPYNFTWQPTVAATYLLTAKATDNNGSSTVSSKIKVVVNETPLASTCSGTGGITWEYWPNIKSTTIAAIPTSTTASKTSVITSFSGPVNYDDFYGSRIRGFLCPPISGNYVFFIAADDFAELWLSTDDNPANKVKIATVNGWTVPGDYIKNASQRSVSISLQAGQRYYIEALQIESNGGDNLSVAWLMPDGNTEAPIPGARLIPFMGPAFNAAPVVSITSPITKSKVTVATPIVVTTTATDSDGTIAKVEFFIDGNKVAEDISSPYNFTWTPGTPATYTLTAKATDNLGASTTSDFATVTIEDFSGTCAGKGGISWQYWLNIKSTSIAAIPTNTAPSGSSVLNSFAGPSNFNDFYGSRIRGFICPPKSGSYVFYIAADDFAELWLSSDDNPANKVKIASVDGWTAPGDYFKNASQQSVKINLLAGHMYYIEALQIESNGGDNLSVAWQMPDGVSEAPIPGSRLIPYMEPAFNQAPVISITSPVTASKVTVSTPINIVSTATDSDGSVAKVEFFVNGTKIGEDLSSPYNFTWTPTTPATYSFTARATDNLGASTTSGVVSVTVEDFDASCSGKGGISWQYWANIKNTTISAIPLTTVPTGSSVLTAFSAPVNFNDFYGSRIRGYICPPKSGSYVFFIAADDFAELWLSTDENPANKVNIAAVYGWTAPGDYTKNSSQRSVVINLLAGRKYYVEALQIESNGGDNLSVAWQMPDGTIEAPIPGARLIPYSESTFTNTITNNTANTTTNTTTKINQLPVVSITSPVNNSRFTVATQILITSAVADTDGSIAKVEFFVDGTKIGEDVAEPFNFTWTPTSAGNFTLTARATDNSAATATSASVIVTTEVAAGSCSGTGGISWQFWSKVPFGDISGIPVNTPPATSGILSSFAGPNNINDFYGTRIRGYICPPKTGSYVFFIAADDKGELWLSTDGNASNKQKIAFIDEWTSPGDYTKNSSQRSVAIKLQAGQRYYVEALQLEGSGGDNLSVAWQLPDGTMEAPIPGTRLIPFDASIVNQAPIVTITSPAANSKFVVSTAVTLTTTATDADGTISKVEFFAGTVKIGETLTSPFNFTWTPTTDGTYTITAKATDNSGASATSAGVDIIINLAAGTCSGTGGISWQYWARVPFGDVSIIPVNTASTGNNVLTSFAGPINIGDNYGSRIRGYICPPKTGKYTFFISADDKGELWLSTDETVQSKQLIAYITDWSGPGDYTKNKSQQSKSILLQAGQRYYVEALQLEGGGGDNLSVAWTLPDGTLQAPIPGNYLIPFTTSIVGLARSAANNSTNTGAGAAKNPFAKTYELGLEGYPNPFVNTISLDVSIPENNQYILQVYTVQGVLLKTIFNGSLTTGISKFKFDGGRLQSGIYICRLSSGKKVINKQITIIR